jgi:hypothetical protein
MNIKWLILFREIVDACFQSRKHTNKLSFFWLTADFLALQASEAYFNRWLIELLVVGSFFQITRRLIYGDCFVYDVLEIGFFL